MNDFVRGTARRFDELTGQLQATNEDLLSTAVPECSGDLKSHAQPSRCGLPETRVDEGEGPKDYVQVV